MELTKESIIGSIFDQFQDVFVSTEGSTTNVYVVVKSPDRKVAERVAACREKLCDMLPNVYSVVQIIDAKDDKPDDVAIQLAAVRVTFGYRWAGDEDDHYVYTGLDPYD